MNIKLKVLEEENALPTDCTVEKPLDMYAGLLPQGSHSRTKCEVCM
jgi:hypothetical protein